MVPVEIPAPRRKAIVDESVILKCDFLLRRGNIVKSWKKRYVVVSSSQIAMYKTDILKEHPIMLFERDDIIEATKILDQNVNKPFLFAIERQLEGVFGRYMICSCSSEEERKEWIESIQLMKHWQKVNHHYYTPRFVAKVSFWVCHYFGFLF